MLNLKNSWMKAYFIGFIVAGTLIICAIVGLCIYFGVLRTLGTLLAISAVTLILGLKDELQKFIAIVITLFILLIGGCIYVYYVIL